MNSTEAELLANLNQMILETPTSDQRDTLCDAVIYILAQRLEIKDKERELKGVYHQMARRRY